MNNIFKEIAEAEEAIERVKNNQDQILDMYEPNNVEMNKLLKELVSLQLQYEKLRQDFIDLSKTTA
jgi:septal ring factor EnvC (AmiA/AmiB activator)